MRTFPESRTSGLLRNVMLECVPTLSKVHRLLRKKRRRKWEQYHHPARYRPGRLAVCGTSGNATSVLGKSGMSSCVRTPSPWLPNPRTFIPVCLAQHVFNATSARERKVKLCVILQPSCDARCTPGFGSPLITHFGPVLPSPSPLSRRALGVVPRYVAPLR